ncbi:MAG: GAF domain-containing protein [Candidatus Rokuibacteriota bacterium]
MRSRALEALYTAARTMASGDLATTVEQTLDMLCAVSRMDFGGVFRYDAEAEVLTLVAHRGLTPEDVEELRVRPIAQSHVGEAVRTGRVVVTDLTRSRLLAPRVRARVRARKYRTQLALPISVGDRPWGVMALISTDARSFDRDELTLLLAVAHQVGLAAARTSLLSEAQQKSRRLDALMDLAQGLTAALAPEQVLQHVVDAAVTIFGSSIARLWLVDEGGQTLSLRASAGSRSEVVGIARFNAGQGLVGHVVASRASLVVPDVRVDPRVRNVERLRAEGTIALAVAPLLLGDRVLGALAIALREPHRYTDEEVAVLEALATQGSIALENARLYSEASRHRLAAEELARLAQTLTETLEVSEVVERTVASALHLFDVRSSILRLLQPDGSLVALAVGGAARGQIGPGHALPPGAGISGRVVAEGRPVWTTDMLRDDTLSVPEDLRRGLDATGEGSLLGVPLRAKGETLGVLSIGDRPGRQFTEGEVALLQTFADQAALALENARLFSMERSRRRQIATLAEIERELAAELEPDRLLDLIVRRATDLFDARGAIFLLEGETLEPRAWVEAGAVTGVRIGEGLVGTCAGERQGLIANDYPRSPYALAQAVGAGIAHAMAQPLVRGGELLGVISMNRASPTPAPFLADDLALLQSFAAQAAVAIQNARLYAEAREYGARLRALEEVNRLVSSSLNTEEVLANLARALAQFFEAPYVSLWAFDPATQRLQRTLTHDPSGIAHRLEDDLALGQGATGWAARERSPVLWAAVESDPRVVGNAELLAHGLRWITAYPITIGDRLLGAFTVCRATAPPVTPETASVTGSLAAQAAVALDNASLYSETSRRLAETRALLDIAEILGSTLDSRQLLKRVAIKIAQVCRVDRCSIELWEGDRVTPLMSQFADGRRESGMWEAFQRVSTQPLREIPANKQAIDTRRPVVVDDTSTSALVPRNWIELFGLKSCLVVPMIRQEQVTGVLTLDYCERPTRFQPWQEDLATAIAGQLALALENTKLYAEVRERLRETTALLAVGRVLQRPGAVADTMRLVAREVANAFGADMVGAYLLDEPKEALVAVAGYHVPRDLLGAFLGKPMRLEAFSALLDAWRDGRASYSDDVLNDDRFDAAWKAGLPPHSVLFVPTIAHGEPVGGLFVVWWRTGRPFPPAEISLAEGVAAQVGLAIESAGLFEENRRRVEELSVLHDLSRAVTGQLDRAAVIEAIRSHVARVLDARNMVMILRDVERGDLEVALRIRDGAEDREPPLRYPAGTTGLMTRVLESGQPVRTDDYLGDCARLGVIPVPASAELRHWLGVPMIAGAHPLGVLTLRGGERPFTDADERLLLNIAHLAALALSSARLFEERTRAYSELSAAQDQLVRTEKLRALGEMASGVAHDFNNLLASVLGRAQLLLRRVEDPQQRQWLEVIERSALDGARTVRRLQEFTRIRRDQALVPVDLNQVIRDALDLTQSRWREEPRSRSVMIDVQTTLDAVPKVLGDAADLREAMTNLILNAVDAMPRGGTLRLATRATGGLVEVVVEDTGGGIPAAIRDRIFDPFFTTKGPQGTGLGLSVTYGLVSRHGGTIAVESDEGRGSRFRLTFPAGSATVAAPPPERIEIPGVDPLRCLVVDDEEPVGAVLGEMLESAGHKVRVVDDGAEAIARFRAETFDLVLTDLAMPNVSGWQVARAVKDAAPHVPVFLVTGFGVELSADELRAHSVDRVLVKPLQIEEILNAVAEVARTRAGSGGTDR